MRLSSMAPRFYRDCANQMGFGNTVSRKLSAQLLEARGVINRKRSFHDYFTAHLRLSEQFVGSDSVPLGRKPGKNSDETSAGSRGTTVVRIPLRSAKQHFGVTRSRGTRPYNEDWYQAGLIDLPIFPNVERATGSEIHDHPILSGERSAFYFGIFDGHGGDDCSEFLKDHLHTYIEETAKEFGLGPPSNKESVASTDAAAQKQRKRLQQGLVDLWKDTVGGYFKRFKPDFGGGYGRGVFGYGGIEAVLMYSFLKADLDFVTKSRPWWRKEGEKEIFKGAAEANDEILKAESNPFKGGSTASLALISTSSATPFWEPSTSSTLITAHLGDTRILLCSTSTGLAIPLTTNHHPSSPLESRRLRRYAAAFVSDSFGEERFGVLSNTRAFGDVQQKRLGVSAEPEITRRELGPAEYSFMVLISDGVSATLTDQEVVDIVKECETPDKASKEIVDFAEEVTAEGDNATALVIRLGGWEKRSEGGDGWMGTKNLRAWRRDEAVNTVRRRT